MQPPSAQLLRPGPAARRPGVLRHHPQLPGLPHLLLPHVHGRQRVEGDDDAYKRCRYYLDIAIDALRPGVTTADIARLWPRAEEFGFPNEEAAFALQYGHGVGLSVWEKPLISRLVSLDHPEPIEEGMVIALETFWPSSDGWSAARIEEQMVVTKDGCEVITRFPAEELMVAGPQYHTALGPLPRERETESHRNSDRALPEPHSTPTTPVPAPV